MCAQCIQRHTPRSAGNRSGGGARVGSPPPPGLPRLTQRVKHYYKVNKRTMLLSGFNHPSLFQREYQPTSIAEQYYLSLGTGSVVYLASACLMCACFVFVCCVCMCVVCMCAWYMCLVCVCFVLCFVCVFGNAWVTLSRS